MFPWDPAAADGEPFSSSYMPPYQGHGRFDLPEHRTSLLYLAEDPVHAVAERIQDLRNQDLEPDDLMEGGHRYALVETSLPDTVFADIADLCAPDQIARLDAAPDAVAARARRTTQALSGRLHAEGCAGLRWWSVFWGEWHSLIVFRDRLPAPPAYGAPVPLDFDHLALREAALRLGIRLRPRKARKG